MANSPSSSSTPVFWITILLGILFSGNVDGQYGPQPYGMEQPAAGDPFNIQMPEFGAMPMNTQFPTDNAFPPSPQVGSQGQPEQARSQPQQGPALSGGQENPGGSTPSQPASGGAPPGVPSPQDIMDFIRNKYHDLFPTAGSPSPRPDPATLYPLPDMSNLAQRVPKAGMFYSFSPVHGEALHEVRQILLSGNSTVEMLDIAKSLQKNQNVHPHLWYYALANLAQKNPDLQVIHRVPPIDALPDLFIYSETLRLARQQRRRGKRQNQQTCVVADETVGADNGIENAMWYFRESIGINSHHWYYHTMYPFGARQQEDRHGELFYYLHSAIVARYNADRFSNGLSRVQPIAPLQRGTTVEGYNPHLRDDNSGMDWTPRPANLPVSDILHQNDPNLQTNVLFDTHILQARARVLQSINDGFVINTRNQRISINNIQGINILGNIIQSNQWSINPSYYGSTSSTGIHNNGHLIFGFIADPQYRSRTAPGVMGDAAPAMRDPLFYRWHQVVQEMFLAHKDRLTPYTPNGGELPLMWPGVRVTGLAVVPAQSGTTNQVTTFWSQQSITISRGLDLQSMPNTSPIQICAKQLDHEEFTYQLTVNNDNQANVQGTVRIFLAPRFDENGNRFSMMDQRRFFFVLDTYGVQLRPGVNNLQRRSVDSTLTVPWAQSLQELNSDASMRTPYCGCGWPRNMLLPKGTPAGMVFDLFVMVTNSNDDFVPGGNTQQCIAAPLFCGVANQLYPDAKPMGYPFDRLPYSVNQRVVANLDEYVAGVPNMGTIQMVVRFTGQ